MERNAALDGIRAIAALLVLAFHSLFPRIPGGFLGVDIFFVLSGYLITTLLQTEFLRDRSIDIQGFYIRRLLRLFPPLLAMLAVYLMVAPALLPEHNHWSDVALVILYVSDYSYAFWQAPSNFLHSWSLSVEEHFYLLWPFVMLLLLGMEKRKLAIILLLIFCIGTLWRVLSLAIWQDWEAVYYRFDTRFSGLALGSVLAVISRDGVKVSAFLSDWISAASAIILVWTLFFFQPYRATSIVWGVTAAEISSFGLILSMLGSRNGYVYRLLTVPPLPFLGLISYSLYIWHFPIYRMLRDVAPPAVNLSVTLLASILFAILSWYLIEKPLAAVRRSLKRPVVA